MIVLIRDVNGNTLGKAEFDDIDTETEFDIMEMRRSGERYIIITVSNERYEEE